MAVLNPHSRNDNQYKCRKDSSEFKVRAVFFMYLEQQLRMGNPSVSFAASSPYTGEPMPLAVAGISHRGKASSYCPCPTGKCRRHLVGNGLARSGVMYFSAAKAIRRGGHCPPAWSEPISILNIEKTAGILSLSCLFSSAFCFISGTGKPVPYRANLLPAL